MKWRLDDGQIEVVDDDVAAILRTKTPGERMMIVAEAWEFAEIWIRAAVRHQNPAWSDEQVEAEVCRRMAGEAD